MEGGGGGDLEGDRFFLLLVGGDIFIPCCVDLIDGEFLDTTGGFETGVCDDFLKVGGGGEYAGDD